MPVSELIIMELTLVMHGLFQLGQKTCFHRTPLDVQLFTGDRISKVIAIGTVILQFEEMTEYYLFSMGMMGMPTTDTVQLHIN